MSEPKRIHTGTAMARIAKLLISTGNHNLVARVYSELYPDEEVQLWSVSKEGYSHPYKDGHRTDQVIVSIEVDDDCNDPSAAGGDDGCWRLWSFNPNHSNHKTPWDLGFMSSGELIAVEEVDDSTECSPNEVAELHRKLDVGLAFRLGYYEHGQCDWHLSGQGGPGSDCRFDGRRFAGLLVWEEPDDHMGHTTYEDRFDNAKGFLEVYTAWCNGECYGYSVKTAGGEEIDSCWGFYGNDMEYMFSQIQSATEGKEVIRVTGDAEHLSAYHDVQKKPEEATSE